jgi:hypothetical protein
MSQKKLPEEKIANVAPFGLRMFPALRKQVEEAAAQNGRSMNSEIVARLEASFVSGGQEYEMDRILQAIRETLRKAQRR